MTGEVGADISYYQSFNASQYPCPFIFIRATFGVTLIDPSFVNFRSQAQTKPVPYRGYYHFLVANVGAQAQFNLFAAQVGNLLDGENVMIDDEDYAPTGGLPSRALVNQFAQLCFNKWGIWPIHYSSLSTGRIANCPQTFASYRANNPGGDFWQYTDGQYNYTAMPRGAPGIGACDMNLCNGNLTDYFLAFADPPDPPFVQEPNMAATDMAYDTLTQQEHYVNLQNLGNGNAALWYNGVTPTTSAGVAWLGPVNIAPDSLDYGAGVRCQIMGTILQVTATPTLASGYPKSSRRWWVQLPLTPGAVKFQETVFP